MTDPNNFECEYAFRWLKRNWKLLSSMERQAVAQFAHDLFSMKLADYNRQEFFGRLQGLDREHGTRTFRGSEFVTMFRIFHRPES